MQRGRLAAIVESAEQAILGATVDGAVTSWNAAEIVFLTELIVSELVTNAIRYGLPPIRLRLIRERNL